MSEQINYTPEMIFNYKDSNKLTSELEEYLISIKKCMESCTDSKDFKIKLKKYEIKLSSNKWHRKRFMTHDEKIKKNINSLLNKLTDKNYIEITNIILGLKLDSYNLLEYLCKNIIDKCILEKQYIKNWSYLINNIFSNNLTKWNYNEMYVYKIFLDICQKKFEKFLELDYHNKLCDLYDSDIDAFYKLKNKYCNFIILLSELYLIKFINENTLISIFGCFLFDSNKYYNLELAILITKHVENDHLQNYFLNNYIKKLKLIENLNKKIKFMIMDILENKIELIENKIKNDDIYISDEEIEVKIKNIINEFIIEKDFKYTLGCYKEINIKPKSNKIIYEFILNLIESEQTRFNNTFYLLNKLIKEKVIKYNNIKFGLIEILKDYDDLILDYPMLDQKILKIINSLLKSKIIEINHLKFILNKGLNSKEKINYFLKKINLMKKRN